LVEKTSILFPFKKDNYIVFRYFLSKYSVLTLNESFISIWKQTV